MKPFFRGNEAILCTLTELETLQNLRSLLMEKFSYIHPWIYITKSSLKPTVGDLTASSARGRLTDEVVLEMLALVEEELDNLTKPQ
jgi:hypothetical protein